MGRRREPVGLTAAELWRVLLDCEARGDLKRGSSVRVFNAAALALTEKRRARRRAEKGERS